MNFALIFFGKFLSKTFRTLNLGNGSTWPGHIALKVNKHFIQDMLKESKMKIILIAGTNGKTTTTKLLKTIYEKNGKKVIENPSGANLLNGLASALILNATPSGKIDADAAIFEVDENTLPRVLKQVTPQYVILMNLFRDQLDRYGEVNTIAKTWKSTVEKLPAKTTLILNADDPKIAYLGKNAKAKTLYFGLKENDEEFSDENTKDSSYCPNCGEKLQYKTVFFSHIGDWACPHCHFTRPAINLHISPIYPLVGTYNKYNTLAAVLVAKNAGFSEKQIVESLSGFIPAFGRQETLTYNGKHVQIFLSKNPTGFNQSIQTIKALGAKHVLMILNDNIADGRDISWIWDIQTENLTEFAKDIITSGTRAHDMGLRIKYSLDKPGHISVIPNMSDAIAHAVTGISDKETLYILPTYTAMLEARKILTGKKIL